MITGSHVVVPPRSFRLRVLTGVRARGVFLPRLTEHTDSFLAALLSGTLVEADGCVFARSESPGVTGDEVLLIWPQQATADRTGDGTLRILIDGDVVGEMGDHVELGGGLVGESRNAVGQAESMIGTTIPDSCRTDGGYFLTSGPA